MFLCGELFLSWKEPSGKRSWRIQANTVTCILKRLLLESFRSKSPKLLMQQRGSRRWAYRNELICLKWERFGATNGPTIHHEATTRSNDSASHWLLHNSGFPPLLKGSGSLWLVWSEAALTELMAGPEITKYLAISHREVIELICTGFGGGF